MFSSSKKPYTAITVQIDRLTSEQYEEDDVGGIFDLVEVIRIQDAGPTEAARALRKKLKYGSPHRQIRALVLLDGLIQNAGTRFQRAFADEPLLERLRMMPRDETVDPTVRKKCKALYIAWANAYKGKAGLERIANLYKELPKTQHRPAAAAARQKIERDTTVEDPFAADGDDEQQQQQQPPAPVPTPVSPSRPPAVVALKSSRPVSLTNTSSSSSFSSKLFKDKNKSSSSRGGAGGKFNLSKEKDNMTTALAQASIASTNLLNALQLINREHEQVSANAEVLRRFDACKALRRRILFYIQHVESDQWIGSLVNANDELVKALTAFEIMDRSIDDDSDSDAWEGPGPGAVEGGAGVTSTQQQLAYLKIQEEKASATAAAAEPPALPPQKPPRPLSHPASIAMPPVPTFHKTAPAREEDDDDDEDGDDPFGDANAVATPNERPGMTWKEV